jgi:Carboxypeptidase regulatory-like domain/TonB-dependent Receptor Plug Domain
MIWKSRNTVSLLAFAGFAFILLTSIPVRAQVSGATLSGTITDSSKAVVPNADLSISNVATGEIRNVTTDASGVYSAPNLLPGKYNVTVTKSGFTTAVRSGITLTVGAQQLLNFTLKVGNISQKVEVTGEAPDIQLASSEISGVINQTAVAQLPLNGRDWTQLATLQPGVNSLQSVQANTGTKDRARRGYGVEMTISGSRPSQNNYRIDGISVNDYANSGPGSVEGATLGVDAVQEFSVLTSNYSAEYGRTSGGVINAVTKAGTNTLHGSAYEFLRNDALDAANFFDNANSLAKPHFTRNQFGGSIGGPIRKDNTFFFVDYEGLRENQGVTTPVTVPSDLARGIDPVTGNPTVAVVNGNPLPAPGQPGAAPNADPVTHIDTAVLPYLKLWGRAPQSTVAGDVGTYAFNAVHITTENFGTARLDHKFSDNDSIFGTFQDDLADATQPDPQNEVLVGNSTGRVFADIEETHIFSSRLINAARIGFNRSVHTGGGIQAINPASADPTLTESATLAPGFDNPQIDVLDVPIQPGLNQVEKVNFYHNSYQAYDDLFLTKGIHSLKFGFGVERIQTNIFNPAPAGEYVFNSLQDFLLNNPVTLFAPLPSAPFQEFGLRSTIFGAYVQDDIRLRPTFTLNVGLRYEMSTVPSEVNGRLSALSSPFGQSLQTAVIGRTIFKNPTLRNFEPRIGFAWDPFGDGKTSIRGGFGMFDVLPLPYQLGQFSSNAAPFTENAAANNLNSGDFPNPAFQTLVNNAAGGVSFRVPYVDPNPKRNYVMQWNVAFQRELLPNLTAMIAYVGSRGVHMEFRADDINTTLPTLTSAGYLFTGGPQLSPSIGQMDTLLWNNDSFYRGMEVQINKRMSHGLEVQGSFTWSRAVDGGDGAIASDSFVNSIPSMFYFLPQYRRGPADFNVDKNLTINYMWDVPSSQLLHGVAGWASHGWQLGGIVTVRSGLPFTPLIGGDPMGLNSTSPVAFPDLLNGSGCQSPVNQGNPNAYLKLQCFALPVATPAIASQCQTFGFSAPGTNGPGDPGSPGIAGTCANLLGNGGRNEVTGPGIVDFDFSVFKDNRIRENWNLQFRAEMFNIFNHANFNSPIDNSVLFDGGGNPVGNAGAVDSTSTDAREIQLALRFTF